MAGALCGGSVANLRVKRRHFVPCEGSPLRRRTRPFLEGWWSLCCPAASRDGLHRPTRGGSRGVFQEMAPCCVGRSVCCRSGDDEKHGTDSMVQTSRWAISLSSAAYRKVLIAAIPNSLARVVKCDRHSCLSCTRRAGLRSIAVSLRVVIVRSYAILWAPTSSTTRGPLQRPARRRRGL